MDLLQWTAASMLVCVIAAVLVAITVVGRSRKVRASPYTISAAGARNKDTLDTVKDGKLTSGFNAKTKTGEPAYDLSRLWYSLYGMEMYPGYLLARYAEHNTHVEDLGWLVDTLKDKLSWAEESMRDVFARRELLKTYVPLLQLPPPESFMNKNVLDAARGEVQLPSALDEVVDHVYRFSLFTPEFCEQLIAQVEHFLSWQTKQVEQGVPGSKDLSTRLCVVEQMGPVGEQLLDLLKNTIMDPLSRKLFPDVLNPDGDTSFRYGFIIGYSDSLKEGGNISRKALDTHTDDSEVTMTICLGREYTGGNVILRHLREDPNEGEEQTRIKMETGQATLFYGQQLHQVEDITSGERHIFVIWARSNKYRAANCPCCRMYRRNRCVCGPEMN
eukprot:GEMP01019200.1.p1 GENE.GEMP01019200.1~~GEMP01019200.1.p1  ORF type:complete len:387 (+),score=62.71 GEMP01019200.1:142-1302(+)